MRADLVLVSLEEANMFPVYNPYSALVYCANTSNVRHVMTSGVMCVRDGRLVHTDLYALREQLRKEMKPFLAAAERYTDII